MNLADKILYCTERYLKLVQICAPEEVLESERALIDRLVTRAIFSGVPLSDDFLQYVGMILD